MKTRRSAASLLGLAMLLCTASSVIAQSQPEVRRARPVDEPPVPRALPADESVDRVLRSLKEESSAPSQPSQHEGEGAAQRQLDYANGLFTRKLYDLAAPEYQKYLDDYPGRAGRANAYFSLGECYRNLSRTSGARTNLQKVLNDYADSEFAGPAAYALAEMAFADKGLCRGAFRCFIVCRKIKGTSSSAFRALFRSALSRGPRPKGGSCQYLCRGCRGRKSQSLSARTHESRQHRFLQREEEKSMR